MSLTYTIENAIIVKRYILVVLCRITFVNYSTRKPIIALLSAQKKREKDRRKSRKRIRFFFLANVLTNVQLERMWWLPLLVRTREKKNKNFNVKLLFHILLL